MLNPHTFSGEPKKNDALGNALYSEYCATLIMKSVVKYFYDNIEYLEEIHRSINSDSHVNVIFLCHLYDISHIRKGIPG